MTVSRPRHARTIERRGRGAGASRCPWARTARCRCRRASPPSSPPPTIAGCERERPVERARIGIDEQLRGVEAMARCAGRTGRARAVRSARPRRRRRRSRGTRRRCARGNAMRSISCRPLASKRQNSMRARVRGGDGDVRRRPRASVTPSGSGLPGPTHAHCVQARRSARGASVAIRARRSASRAASSRRRWPSRAAACAATTARSRRNATARPIASSRLPRVTGANWMPVPAPAASAISLASMTVSARPPTRATIGNGAVAQRAKLREAAGLEARRHEQRVGAALHEMRERLVVADDRADAPRMARGGRDEAVFERLVARADERELRAGRR